MDSLEIHDENLKIQITPVMDRIGRVYSNLQRVLTMPSTDDDGEQMLRRQLQEHLSKAENPIGTLEDFRAFYAKKIRSLGNLEAAINKLINKVHPRKVSANEYREANS